MLENIYIFITNNIIDQLRDGIKRLYKLHNDLIFFQNKFITSFTENMDIITPVKSIIKSQIDEIKDILLCLLEIETDKKNNKNILEDCEGFFKNIWEKKEASVDDDIFENVYSSVDLMFKKLCGKNEKCY